MRNNSFIKAIAGVFLAYLGFAMTLSGVFYSVINSLLVSIGFPTSVLLAGSITAVIIGLVLLYIGLKLFFENESGFAKLLFGVLGIVLFIIGFLAVLGGSVTFGLSLFATLLLWSISFTFMRYAFELDFLKPFDKLLRVLKQTLGVKK